MRKVTLREPARLTPNGNIPTHQVGQYVDIHRHQALTISTVLGFPVNAQSHRLSGGRD